MTYVQEQVIAPQHIAEDVEPWPGRMARCFLQCLQSDASRVSAFGKLWRLILLVPVFGLYLIIARLRLRMKNPIEVVSQTDAGLLMQCRPPDLVMMYIRVFGVWEPDISRFMTSRLQPGDTFIDIGANVGYYSLLAASVVGNKGKVVAIEASPRIYNRLRANIERNPALENMRAINVAAAAEPGELIIRLGPEHNLGRTTTVAESGYEAEATVQALPVHQILTDEEIASARLVKIDVEGGEDVVLAGMREFLERCNDDVEVLVEMTPQWWAKKDQNLDMVLQPFFDAGFHAYYLPNNYWPWRYAWPNDVARPKRVRFDLSQVKDRLDLVLSRVDAEWL